MMCNHENSDVLSSRKSKKNPNIVSRRRVCRDCGYRWTTYEVPIEYFKGFKARQLAQGMNLMGQIDECRQSLDSLSGVLSTLS